jgi:hypothetical protein
VLVPTWSLLSPRGRRALIAAATAYGAGLGYATAHAWLRHRSARVAAAFAVAAPASHLAYGTGVVRGLLESHRARLIGSELPAQLIHGATTVPASAPQPHKQR